MNILSLVLANGTRAYRQKDGAWSVQHRADNGRVTIVEDDNLQAACARLASVLALKNK